MCQMARTFTWCSVSNIRAVLSRLCGSRDRNRTFESLVNVQHSGPGRVDTAGATTAWPYLASGNYLMPLGFSRTWGGFITPQTSMAEQAPYVVLSMHTGMVIFMAMRGIVGRQRRSTTPLTIIVCSGAVVSRTELFLRRRCGFRWGAAHDEV